MKRTLPLISLVTVFLAFSCNSSDHYTEQDNAEATVTDEAGEPAPLPKDVLYASKPLVSGKIYARPSFGGTILAHFDTSQQLHIIDTTGTVFVKVRMLQDTSTHTGYMSRIILPEQK